MMVEESVCVSTDQGGLFFPEEDFERNGAMAVKTDSLCPP